MANTLSLLRANYNVDRRAEHVWEKLRKHPISKQYNLTSLDIAVMTTIVGYHKKVRTPGNISYGNGGWLQNARTQETNSDQQDAVAILIAIAVKEEGLEVLNKTVNEIQSISEEYGNGGVHELWKIFNLESDTIIFNEIIKMMRKAI